MEVNKNGVNNPMMFGGNCPYMQMEMCPMVPSMCSQLNNQMMASPYQMGYPMMANPYPMGSQMMSNQMMNTQFSMGTYIKIKSVPLSQLIG
ncbi:MAG: hypothetical protein AB6733_06165 [Clostridiaceae bacterium]